MLCVTQLVYVLLHIGTAHLPGYRSAICYIFGHNAFLSVSDQVVISAWVYDTKHSTLFHLCVTQAPEWYWPQAGQSIWLVCAWLVLDVAIGVVQIWAVLTSILWYEHSD